MEPSHEPGSAPARTLRVLLIEDSEDDADLLLHELRRGGYDPTWERVDTAAALTAALARPWDVITCDYVMPQFSGPAALQLIHDLGVDLPVIIVSGQVGEEVAVSAMKAGAHDFVSKHKLARLCPAIERELRDWEGRRARKHAEEALRNSEEHFRALIEHAFDLVAIVDAEGVYRYASPSHQQASGFTPEELVGRNGFEFLHPDDEPRLQQMLAAAIERNEQIVTVEYRFRHKDGSWRFVEGTFKNLLDDPAVGGVLVNARDVTDRTRAEAEITQLNVELERRVAERTAQLEAANKELEAFSYSVSHDLRAPLRAIAGFSQALLEDYGDTVDPQAKRYLERVHANTDRMGQLINDLLSLSRVSRMEVQYRPVDLSAAATAIAGELQSARPERTVQFVIAPDLIAIGDPALLRVALENLLENAWKYTGKHPSARIEFGTTEHGDERLYFVRDDGAGFDMAYASKLFGAFQRLHAAAEFEGTGIGLATVQRIIHRHGGRVWAEGAPERGATFYFTLPARQT